MDRPERRFLRLGLLFFLILFLFAKQNLQAKEFTDEEIIDLLEVALRKIPEEIKTLNPEIKKVFFYSLRGDRVNISQPLLRQLQGKIESILVSAGLKLVYAPGFKPLQIGVAEEKVTLVSGFKDVEEMKDTAQKLRLDGFMEGEIFLAQRAFHLNLRIFDAETFTIVWSKEFTNTLPPRPPKVRTTGIDIGIGQVGLGLDRTASSQDLAVPTFAYYYSADLRITQISQLIKNSRYIVGAHIFYLSEGVDTKKATLVSGSLVGGGFATRAGLSVSLLKSPNKNKNRSWLALEMSAGRIFGLGTPGHTAFFLGVECDITEDISSVFRIAYVIPKEITVKTNKKVSVGGIYYEVSLLRFNFNP